MGEDKKNLDDTQEGDATWEDAVQYLNEIAEVVKLSVRPFISMVNNLKGRLEFTCEKDAVVYLSQLNGKIDGINLKCHLMKPAFLQLKNVPKLDVVDDELINFELLEQFGINGAKIVRKIFNVDGKDRKKKATCGTLVISVGLPILDIMQRKKFVFGLWKMGDEYQFRGKFEYDVFIPFCSNCKQWGHFASKCKGEAKCDCGKENHEGNCVSTTCVNCGEKHQPWNGKKCRKYKQLVNEWYPSSQSIAS